MRDRGAAHVQRRRRGRAGRLLHRQRHRRRAAFVGDRRLVRIESVGQARRRPRRWSASGKRTTATARMTRRVAAERRPRRILAFQTAPRPKGRQAPFSRPGPEPVERRLAPRTRSRMANSYAIVETGGKQYRAEKGANLLVETAARGRGRQGQPARRHVPGDKDVVLDGGQLEKVKVEAVVDRAPARPEGPDLQVQGEEGLPPPRRSPPGAHPARGDRGTHAHPQARGGGQQAGAQIGGAEGRGGGPKPKAEAKPKAAAKPKAPAKPRRPRSRRLRPRSRPQRSRPRGSPRRRSRAARRQAIVGRSLLVC